MAAILALPVPVLVGGGVAIAGGATASVVAVRRRRRRRQNDPCTKVDEADCFSWNDEANACPSACEPYMTAMVEDVTTRATAAAEELIAAATAPDRLPVDAAIYEHAGISSSLANALQSESGIVELVAGIEAKRVARTEALMAESAEILERSRPGYSEDPACELVVISDCEQWTPAAVECPLACDAHTTAMAVGLETEVIAALQEQMDAAMDETDLPQSVDLDAMAEAAGYSQGAIAHISKNNIMFKYNLTSTMMERINMKRIELMTQAN